MTITIRSDAFETNSSSMHSVVIMKDDGRRYTEEEYSRSMYINDDGAYDLIDEEELEFGRAPFRVLVAPGDKVKYAIASLCGPLSEQKDKANAKLAEITEIMHKHFPKLTQINLPTGLVRLWKDRDDNLYEPWETAVDDDGVRRAVNDTGDRVRVEIDQDFYDKICYGYVDHQSELLLQNFLKDTGTSLEDFLTMPKYIVLVDGDEYYEGEKLAHYGILNLANAEIYDKGEHQNWMHG